MSERKRGYDCSICSVKGPINSFETSAYLSIWYLVHNRYLIQLVKERRIRKGKRDGGRERGKEKVEKGLGRKGG